MFRTVIGIMTSPLIAIALLCVGILAAVAHLFALPVPYLWEHYLERRPLASTSKQRSRGR